MRYAMALALCVALVGCSSADYSKNMRAATAQASSTVAVKAVLDEVAADRYDVCKKQIIEVAQDLSKFLDDGKIGDLPLDAAKDAVIAYMQKKGWSEYVPIVTGIFVWVEAQKVPTEKLGPDNIAIIKLGLDAVCTSANTSRMEWRRVSEKGLLKMKVRTPNKVKLYHADN